MGEALRQRVTSHDVAKAAGVSRTTVSFVLNGASGQSIPEATRQAVLRAARELGYVPSAAASALRSGGVSRLVLVLAPDWEPAAVTDTALSELTRELRSLSHATLVARSAEDPDDLELVWRTVSPAAVVSLFDPSPAVRTRLERMGVPLIEVFLHSYGDRAAHEDVQSEVGRSQALHLLERGADRLAYVHPAGVREPAVPLDRLRGAREASRAHGGGEVEAVTVPAFGAPALAPIRGLLARRGGGRLGICAYNDSLAVAAVTEAAAAGIRVPQDVLVIGVDDDPVTEVVRPTVSSVRFNAGAHMRRVAAAVADAVGMRRPRPVPADPVVEVVRRESTS
ncbi:LacI family DNA-binding transcriptional regulator [Nocardiopsis sp. RSe5-2]|uniref:LacI family DNA-binding transcriptional regulator n=1 Tax=Nocardiopsis endophytica TaxID=3018445 RepID=A0ABT4TXF3_9ACTN|nr:LacI family DNA-binding transcriptional regulator [Nocardiopsis endophytica]MDA2809364.1 LacI family DNA-binding transcriptional regulator [Nocardiopsis endophytica]